MSAERPESSCAMRWDALRTEASETADYFDVNVPAPLLRRLIELADAARRVPHPPPSELGGVFAALDAYLKGGRDDA